MDGDPGQGPPPPPNISSSSDNNNGREGEKKDADASVGPEKGPNSTGFSCSAGGVSLEFGSDDNSEIVRAAVDTSSREGKKSSKQQQHQGRSAPAAAAAVVAQREKGGCVLGFGFCRAGGCV